MRTLIKRLEYPSRSDTLHNGDIGLVKAPRGLLGWPAMWAGQTYEHAFLVHRVGNALWLIEAGWRGIVGAPLYPCLAFCDFVRPKYRVPEQANIGNRVVEYAMKRMTWGEPYGFWDLVRPGWFRIIQERLRPKVQA